MSLFHSYTKSWLHYASRRRFRKADRETQSGWSPCGFANSSNSQKRNCRRNLRDARMCPRFARASSSIPPVILRLASSAASISAKRSPSRTKMPFTAETEKCFDSHLEFDKMKSGQMRRLFVTVIPLPRNLLRSEIILQNTFPKLRIILFSR